MNLRRMFAGLAVLFGAYVCGRAAGILLDVNPWVTELIAIVLVLGVWTASRRDQ